MKINLQNITVIGDVVSRYIIASGYRQLMFGIEYHLGSAVVYVREDFITDFASIPNFVRFWIDNDDKEVVYGAIFHDYIYFQGGYFVDEASGRTESMTRKQADKIFKELCIMFGMSKFKAWTAYAAIRIFGKNKWVS